MKKIISKILVTFGVICIVITLILTFKIKLDRYSYVARAIELASQEEISSEDAEEMISYENSFTTLAIVVSSSGLLSCICFIGYAFLLIDNRSNDKLIDTKE